MKDKLCFGCGEKLQTENKNEKGYIPLEKYILNENILCMRCFRLKNYGEIPKETNDIKTYKEIVEKSIKNADFIMPIFDVIDLEASMTTEILDILEDKKSIVVLNKMDLLPKYFTTSEISQWFSQKIYDENIFPEAFCYVSAKNRAGINGILRKIKSLSTKKEVSICVIGASNVGKSSILNRLLDTDKLTVSKFSGTTQKSIKTTIKYKDMKIKFIDTPGLIPQGRIGDLLSPKKAIKLVPNREISRKTFKLKEGQYFMLSNLIYFRVNENVEIQVFASKDIKYHITNEEKVEKIIKTDFFELLDENEREQYFKNKFITQNMIVEKAYDLVISGLGFIEIKKKTLNIDITYPEYVNISTRDSISKLKRINNEEDEYLW